MRPQTSPLLGYNTNIRHKGKLYHIQTEDSGINRPHIITHLFADGGRIVASTKTEYAQHLGTEELPALVKAKMQEQHKAMLIALRDGHYDGGEPQVSAPVAAPSPAVRARPDVETLERAAHAKLASSVALSPRPVSKRRTKDNSGPPRAAPDPPAPARKHGARSGAKPRPQVKTLDDVIRSYLDDDADPSER